MRTNVIFLTNGRVVRKHNSIANPIIRAKSPRESILSKIGFLYIKKRTKKPCKRYVYRV